MLDDLAEASVRDKLQWAMSEPERLRPGESRQTLTERAAAAFAALAQRLRERGHEPQEVAHFVNRMVFCMFAEDVGLLPRHIFTRMLEQARIGPDQFAGMARSLFGAMATGGLVGFEPVAWFDGGLFDDDAALALTKPEIEIALKAAALDWSEIDPSILGMLFERGLDPGKRAQLGAHYTDRDKIMLIVEPVVVRPLLAEWQTAKAEIAASLERSDAARSRAAQTRHRGRAERLLAEFLERLRRFTVLDPACGSGNFLYLALHALKDLEHRALLEAEAMGLQRTFPMVSPANVKGIEINAYAAELARVSVWIGEIQWMRRNGFTGSRDPILEPLDNIECRDAILAPEGGEPEWPEADVVIGNPPFLGGKLLNGNLGEEYVARMFAAYKGRVPAEADLVTYWFVKAGEHIGAGKAQRAGLVATNSIRGGANRRALRAAIDGRLIYDAWSDEPWGDRRRSRPGFADLLLWRRRRTGAGITTRRPARGPDPCRSYRAAGKHRNRPDQGTASVEQHRRRFHGRHKGRAVRNTGRRRTAVASAPREPERAAQRRRAQAVDERHGCDSSSQRQVGRRLRLGAERIGSGIVRGAVSACPGACSPDAATNSARRVSRLLVETPQAPP